jgi:hypothetical protein
VTESLSAFFRETMAKLPPEPRFDRFAVRDLRPFASVERRDASGDLGHGLPLPLLGIPVVSMRTPLRVLREAR